MNNLDGVNRVSAGLEAQLMFAPKLLAVLLVMWAIFKFALLPMLDAWGEARKAKRDIKAAAEKHRKQRSAEIVLRGEFDDWLDAEVLRLQIESAADRANAKVITALGSITAARTENSARIAALLKEPADEHLYAGQAVTLQTLKEEWQNLKKLSAGITN